MNSLSSRRGSESGKAESSTNPRDKAASASKSVKKDNVSGALKLFKIAHNQAAWTPEGQAP
jgi:hypothetical protein